MKKFAKGLAKRSLQNSGTTQLNEFGGRMFQRRIEDFACENCGLWVEGNGYTNHCPECLWSKHVDVYPGDRASACKGAMKPMEVEKSATNSYTIRHKCLQCGLVRKNKISTADNFEALLKI